MNSEPQFSSLVLLELSKAIPSGTHSLNFVVNLAILSLAQINVRTYLKQLENHFKSLAQHIWHTELTFHIAETSMFRWFSSLYFPGLKSVSWDPL